MLRLMAVGLTLFTSLQATAQDAARSAVDIRQLQCDAAPVSSAANAASSSGMSSAAASSDQSKDFQAAILSDTTLNGPARAGAAGNDAAHDTSDATRADPTGSSASAGQTSSDGTAGVSRDQPAAPPIRRCQNTLNAGDGDRGKDVKILQVSPSTIQN